MRRSNSRRGLLAVLLATFSTILLSCSKPKSSDSSSSSSAGHLYVAAGACYAGSGNTTFSATTSSNLVYSLDLSSGQRDLLIADYLAAPSNTGDSPVGVLEYDDANLLVVVENSTAGLRRIEKIPKANSGARTIYSQNSTALSAQLRRVRQAPGGWLLVSKSTDVEKMKDGTNRIMSSTYPFIHLANPPATSNCSTANTLISDLQVLGSGGLIAVAHAAAGKTGFAVLSATGYAAVADCKNNVFQAAPQTTTFPSAMAYDSVNHYLLVAYAGSTTATDINSIYAYSIDEATGAIGTGQKVYDAATYGSTYPFLLYAVSAMAFDKTSKNLYVATATSSATTVANYRIERLHYDPTMIGSANTSVLTYDRTFYNFGNDTKCISQLTIGN